MSILNGSNNPPSTAHDQLQPFTLRKHQWRQWVDSSYRQLLGVTDWFCPRSGYSKDLKSNGMACWSRPKSATGLKQKPRLFLTGVTV